MVECPRLSRCGFFKKYNETKNLACRGFIVMYCRGDRQAACKRAEYSKAHGAPPPDDMMPDGGLIR